MLVYNLPNELTTIIGSYLEARDLYHLILVNSGFYTLLLSRLLSFALRRENWKIAIYWAVLSGDQDLALYILRNGEDTKGLVDLTAEAWVPTVYLFSEDDDETIPWVADAYANLSSCIEFPLYYSVEAKHDALLRLVLSTGEVDVQLCTSVITAALHKENEGAIEILSEWVFRSFEEEIYKKFLNDALIEALWMRNIFMVDTTGAVRILVTRGADADVLGSSGDLAIVEI